MSTIRGGCETCIHFKHKADLKSPTEAVQVVWCADGHTITAIEMREGCDDYKPPIWLQFRLWLFKSHLADLDI